MGRWDFTEYLPPDHATPCNALTISITILQRSCSPGNISTSTAEFE